MSALEISSVTLKPVIEYMLRTRFCVPDSILVVEGVDVIPLTETGRWCTVRLLLSDNDFCIQALLDGALHHFIQTGEVTVGCYVRLQQFELRWRHVAEESDAEGNKMVYLILHDLVTVGWNRDICDLHKKTTAASLEPLLSEPDEPRQDIDDTESAIVKSRGHQKKPLISQRPHDMRAAHEAAKTEDINLVEAPEAFDAHVRLSRVRMPAGAAGEQTTPRPLQSIAAPPKDLSRSLKTVALPRDWKDPQTPLKLTTLCSIPHLPYKQNWTCNVLAIVVSLSAVEASHFPPYKQRVARIDDPSTNKLVHLTVLLDPEDFVPRIGSALLLAGVKKHRFDGGSLKKYASDKKDRIKWWSEDPWELTWCDVAVLRRFWPCTCCNRGHRHIGVTDREKGLQQLFKALFVVRKKSRVDSRVTSITRRTALLDALLPRHVVCVRHRSFAKRPATVRDKFGFVSTHCINSGLSDNRLSESDVL